MCALVKLSAPISDIRGKIGGIIFQNSAAGLVVKNFTSPVNPNTIRQNNQRIIVNILQQEWILLTEEQRNCWKMWTKQFPIQQNNFNHLPINAQQAFIKINSPFLLYGHTIIKDPVFVPNLRTPVTYTLVTFGVSVRLTCSRAMQNSVEFIELLCTYPQTLTINNPGDKYRSIVFATKNSVSQFVQDEYIALFGRTPIAGQKVFFKARTIDFTTGLASGWQAGLADVN